MQVIIDRIENNIVVVELENNKLINVPIELFPNIKEGDVIDITINKEETNKRNNNIKKLMDDLFE